jgi:hypothetical protein
MAWLLCDYGEVLALASSAADRGALESEAGTGGPGFWAGYWQHRPAYDRADVDTRCGPAGGVVTGRRWPRYPPGWSALARPASVAPAGRAGGRLPGRTLRPAPG